MFHSVWGCRLSDLTGWCSATWYGDILVVSSSSLVGEPLGSFLQVLRFLTYLHLYPVVLTRTTISQNSKFTKQHLGTAWSAACPALVDPVQQHVYPIPPVYAAIHQLPTVSEQPMSETTAAVWLALLRPSNQHAETISTLPPEWHMTTVHVQTNTWQAAEDIMQTGNNRLTELTFYVQLKWVDTKIGHFGDILLSLSHSWDCTKESKPNMMKQTFNTKPNVLQHKIKI